MQRYQVVPERADRQRHDSQKHHDRAVHRTQLVEELRQNDSAWRVGLAEQAAEVRQGFTRIRELPPDDDDEREANQQEKQTGERVPETDDLVIGRKEVFSEQPLRIL